MARLLVAADLTSLAQRAVANRLVERLRADGHDAALANDAPLPMCTEADGVLAILDGAPDPLAIAFAAIAHAQAKPVLALHSHPIPDTAASLFTQTHAVHDEADFAAALPPFYVHLRPHAGKLVRDQIPRLVREAGHQVQFREATPEERPRYLKRKVADEAAELLAADPGQEREEVADLLEALEALLRERGVDREDLKLVKEAKRKRRGAFERCLVVESASNSAPAAATETMGLPAWPEETAAPAPTPVAASPAPTAGFLIPPTPRPAPAPRTESGRSTLWNLGLGGKREAIAPKVDDPDRVDTELRDV